MLSAIERCPLKSMSAIERFHCIIDCRKYLIPHDLQCVYVICNINYNYHYKAAHSEMITGYVLTIDFEEGDFASRATSFGLSNAENHEIKGHIFGILIDWLIKYNQRI